MKLAIGRLKLGAVPIVMYTGIIWRSVILYFFNLSTANHEGHYYRGERKLAKSQVTGQARSIVPACVTLCLLEEDWGTMMLNEPERQRIPVRRRNEDPSKAQRF